MAAKQQKQVDLNDKILTVEDVAKELGCEKKSVYRYINKEGLPMKQRAGQFRILKSTLLTWIDESAAVR